MLLMRTPGGLLGLGDLVDVGAFVIVDVLLVAGRHISLELNIEQ